MKKLVILGSGWGSYSVLRNVNRKFYKIIVISPRNHFLFTPLLTSTTVGTLEFRSITEPVRNVGFRDPHDFHFAEAIKCDFANQIIKCKNTLDSSIVSEIQYDKLVIGVGALPNTFNVPGVREHAYFLKEIVDARKIRERILRNIELVLEPQQSRDEINRLLHTVIVGGGPTGVEFGAELYDFIRQDISRLYREDKNVRVSLIESQKILGAFDARLQAYAEKKFRERKNFNLVHDSVSEVTENGVKLKDGTFLPAGLVVWSTGLAPRDFTKNLDVLKTKQGQIVTNDYLQIISDITQNSYAIGDCCNIQDNPLPCTAQVAERQGRFIANFLNQTAKNSGNIPKSFEFKSMGMLAYIGDYQALSDLPEFKLKGITSWLLWRSAYLTRLGSWRLRFQVPFDWLKALLFGRDTTQF